MRILTFTHRLPILIAAMVAMAVAVLVGDGAPPAQAQSTTPITLISNIGQTQSQTAHIGTNWNEHAQGFRTGANAGGYVLTSIDVFFSAAPHGVDADLHADSSGAPGSKIADLTSPASFTANSAAAFTAPADTKLDPNTNYHVVIRGTAVTVNSLSNTNTNNEDSGGQARWSIADGSHYRTHGTTGSWTSYSHERRIAVKGYALQSPLVSNVGGEADANVFGWFFERSYAQQFTTGANVAGYSMTSVDVKMDVSTTTANTLATMRGEIWSAVASGENAGRPNERIASLTTPTTLLEGADVIYELESSPALYLAPNTKYYFVFYFTSDTGATFTIDHASGNAEDSGGAAGWSIADVSLRQETQTPAADGEWTEHNRALMIRLQGAANDPATDNNLSALTASWSTSATGTFAPLDIFTPGGNPFRRNETGYQVSVENAITHVKIRPTASHGAATVQAGKSGSLAAVGSGSNSGAIALDVGENAITVRVTAQDGSAKDYTVTVTRLASGASVIAGYYPNYATLVQEGETDTQDVRLSAALAAETTVSITTVSATATETADYVILSRTVTFPAGRIVRGFTISAVADMLNEPGEWETVTLGLEAPQGAPYAIQEDLPQNLFAQVEVQFPDTSRAPGITLIATGGTEGSGVTEGSSTSVVFSFGTPFTSDTPITLTALGSSTAVKGTSTSGDYYWDTVPTAEAGDLWISTELRARDDSDDEPLEYIVLQASGGGFTSNIEVVPLRDNDGAPNAPYNVTASPGQTSIYVTWEKQPGSAVTGGDEVQYKAVSAPDAAAPQATATDPSTGWVTLAASAIVDLNTTIDRKFAADITGLARTTAYDVRVRNKNSSGNSPWAYPNVWEGALTVKELTTTTGIDWAVGCDDNETGKKCIPAEAITDNTFTAGGTDFDIEAILLYGRTAATNGIGSTLRIDVNASLNAKSRTLDLRIGERVFRGTAGSTSNPLHFEWVGTSAIPAPASMLTSGSVALVQLSDPAQTTTKAPPPPAPDTFELYTANRALTVFWDYVDIDVPEDLTGYDLQYKTATAADMAASTANDPSTGWVDAGHTGTAGQAAISGLTNGRTYNVRVRGVSLSGGSAWVSGSAAPERTTTIWTATLTVKELDTGKFGCDNTVSGKECSTASILTDDDFRYYGTTFALDHIFVEDGTFAWSLTVDRSAQLLVNGISVADGAIYTWDSGNQVDGDSVAFTNAPTWAAEQSVALSLQVRGLAPPNAPTGLTVTGIGQGLSVSWTAPTGDVTGYDVEYKVSTASAWSAAGHTGTDASATISGLTAGTSYDVRVRAVNSAGNGEWVTSASSTAVLATPTVGFSAASYERIGTTAITEGTHTHATVTLNIDPVLSVASSVTLRAVTDDDAHTAEANDYTLPTSVTLPANSATATFQVAMTDDSLAEFKDVVVIALAAVANAPYTLDANASRATVSITDNDVVTLSFSSTETAADGYTLLFRVAEGGSVSLNVVSDRLAEFPVEFSVSTGVDGDANTADATLTTDYVVEGSPSTIPAGSQAPNPPVVVRTIADSVSDDDERLTASLSIINARPNIQLSPDTAIVIIGAPSQTTPGAVTGLTVAAGHRTLTLAWTGPSETITGYDVGYKVRTHTAWTDAEHTGLTAAQTIEGLTNGVEYDVRVRAVNSNAATPGGLWATASATPMLQAGDLIVKTQSQGGPGRVSIGRVVEGDGMVTAVWPKPTEGTGDPVTGYQVEYREVDGPTWTGAEHMGKARFITITGLTNGTRYELRARATTDNAVAGEWSETATATPRAPDLPALPRAAGAGGAAAFDTSFSDDGKVVTDFGAGDDSAMAVAVQEDGKIVVAGRARGAGNNNDFAVARYNADGSLDEEFGGDGKVVTPIGSGHDVANAVVVQSDGKIVAAGASHNGSDWDFAVVRYNADGTLDTSFGGDGKVVTAVGSGQDGANALVVQENGRIVAAGYAQGASNRDFALVRYNANGTLDTSFGGDGKVVTDFGPGADEATAVTLQFHGEIIAAGHSYNGDDFDDFALARYSPSGELVRTFGNGGMVVTDFDGQPDQINAVTTLPNGMILAVGSTRASTGDDLSTNFALAGYTYHGAPDIHFGEGGVVVTPVGSRADGASAVVVQPDYGKILAAGYTNISGTNDDFALVRYDEHGRLDPSFGNAGKVVTPVGTGKDQALAMALQPDGRVVLAGVSRGASNDDFAVVRYVAPPRRTSIKVDPGETSLIVEWIRPVGDPTGYDVEYKEESATSWTDAGHSGTDRTATITGLTAGATYDVRVRATNGAGAGPWSVVRQGIPKAATQSSDIDTDRAGPVTAVTLALSAATVNEDAGSVTITATLDQPAPNGGLELRLYADTGSTADKDVDYTMPANITVPAGQRSGAARVRITDDTLAEADETAVIGVFAQTDHATLNATVTLTIVDNDAQQQGANRAPTVAGAIADATITSESGTRQVSLSGVFSDADNDALTITAASSDTTKATVSVAADYSTLTVSAQARGTSTITVTAADGTDGTVEDTFTVTVKAAPVVASALADVSGLEAGSARDASLSGVFTDADGDSLTITAASDDADVATVTVAADYSSVTVTGVAGGTAAITVTAEDSDGNTVSDSFTVSVVKAPEPNQDPPPTGGPTVVAPMSDLSLVGPEHRVIDLSDVFSGDGLRFTAVSSNYRVASMWVDGTTLTVVGTGTGTATITVTAKDPDGNEVSDEFDVTVSPAS